MIIIPVPNAQPQTEIGQAVAQDVVLKTIPKQPVEPVCLCSLGLADCDYVEKAFYGGAGIIIITLR